MDEWLMGYVSNKATFSDLISHYLIIVYVADLEFCIINLK